MNETQGFLYLWHSNWTICSLLSWFCFKIFPTSWSSLWGVQLLITPERDGLEMRKGIHSKMNETKRFLYSGHSNWTICSPLSWFCFIRFPTSWSLLWGVQKSNIVLPQREMGWKWEKGSTQKWMRLFLRRAYFYWPLCGGRSSSHFVRHSAKPKWAI